MASSSAPKLDRMLTFEEEWRALIAEVRQHTDAPLTYAANWTDYRQVPFWDALDIIGIQAYFPLTDDPDYDEEDIRAGWAKRMGELRGLWRVAQPRYPLHRAGLQPVAPSTT